jgi:RNase P/RNase MRP subunit POP5
MKPLLPSMREKKRYVVFETITDEFSLKKAEKSIIENSLKLLGEFGISKSGLMLLSDSWEKNKGIIKINPKYVDELKVSLGLMKGDIIINVLGVSGTLKKAKQKFM